MASQDPHRLTQFDMTDLIGPENPSLLEPEGRVAEEQSPAQDRQVLKKNPPKRKRSLSPQREGAIDIPGVRPYDFTLKDASPWDSYWKIYQLKFNRFVTVAVRKEGLRKRFIVKRFEERSSQDDIEMIHRIRHDHIVNVLETFRFENSLYVVLERMAICLVQIVASPAYPGEQELAAILGQILKGLDYLAETGLEHGSLSCSTILLSAEGDVKIADQECCRPVDPSGKIGLRDVRALSRIVMELMQKYVKEDGVVGIENLDRWPNDSAAVDFLSLTTSANSAKDLMKHRLLRCDWRKDWLEWMVDWAGVSAYRLHKPAT